MAYRDKDARGTGPAMTFDGPTYRALMETATLWLEKNAALVNALNVFPVPDGDTGTNMALTMRSTLKAAQDVANERVGAIAQAMAKGALMGARGNSGVILSQIVGGMSKGLGNVSVMTAADLVRALEEASAAAYRSMSVPVEGTMLTVMRRAAAGARSALDGGGAKTVPAVLRAAVDAANMAVEDTPNLLPVLREAGVVDSGGKGVAILLEGALYFALEEPLPEPYPLPTGVSAAWLKGQEAETYGFCTEFLLHGPGLDIQEIRTALERWGESDSLVGDAELLRVHLHTDNPDAVLEYGQSKGRLDQVSVRDMSQQHKQFVAYQQGTETLLKTGVVSVAAGKGLADVMRELGASAVVWGGQTMNPSTEDILNAVEAVPSAHVIVLPNNKNIIPAARQAVSVTGKTIHVLASYGAPQGIGALVAYNPEADIEANLDAMEDALEEVLWGEVTRSVRTTRVDGKQVKAGEYMGLIDEELALTSDSAEGALLALVEELGGEEAELVTVYYGDEVTAERAEEVRKKVEERFLECEVEMVAGGQPHYPYLVSVE